MQLLPIVKSCAVWYTETDSYERMCFIHETFFIVAFDNSDVANGVQYDGRNGFHRQLLSGPLRFRGYIRIRMRVASGRLFFFPDELEAINYGRGDPHFVRTYMLYLYYGLITGDLPARYTLVSAPEHCSVVLTVDGTYRYFPAKGYTGTDTFAYTYNNYLGESETCCVKITVE